MTISFFFALLWKKIKDKVIFHLPLIFFFVLGFALGFYQSRDHWESPLKDTISKYEESERKIKANLSMISMRASADAAIAQMIIIEKENKLEEAIRSYESIKKQSKVKVVRVVDSSGENHSISIDEFGDQICSKFDRAYMITLNDMIKEANRK